MEKGRQGDPGELPYVGPWTPLAELGQTTRYEKVWTTFNSISRDVTYQLIHMPPQGDQPNQYSFMALGGEDYQEATDTKIYVAFIEDDKTLLRIFNSKELDVFLKRDSEELAPDELLEWMRDDMLEQAKLGTAIPNAEDILGFIDIVESWSYLNNHPSNGEV